MSTRIRITAVALAGLALFSGVRSMAGEVLEVQPSAAGIRVSVSAAPLPAVLREVGRAAGVSVQGLEHVTGIVTADLDLPLDVALQRLLRGYSFVLIESPDEGELWILGRAGSPVEPEAPDGWPARPSLQPGLWGAAGVERLTGVVGEEAVQILLDASGSADVEARLTALGGLAQYGPEAVEVIAAAVRDPDPAVRFAAMQHLAGSGAPAIPHLVRVFREAGDPELRLMALSAVAGAAGAVSEDLLALAARDSDPTVRARAAELSRSSSSTDLEGGGQ